MFKRYDLDAYYNSCPIYHASFSSINNLVKFACGFDRSITELVAVDTLFEKTVPIDELCLMFEGDTYGV